MKIEMTIKNAYLRGLANDNNEIESIKNALNDLLNKKNIELVDFKYDVGEDRGEYVIRGYKKYVKQHLLDDVCIDDDEDINMILGSDWYMCS